MKSINFKFTSIFVVLLVMFIPISLSVSLESENPDLVVTFDKVQEMDVVFEKYGINVAANYIDGSPTALEEYHQVILTLTKIDGGVGEEEFQQFVDSRADNGAKIKLVPGKYYMDAHLMVHKNITIPGRMEEWCLGVGQQEPKQAASTFTTSAGSIVAGAAVTSVIGSIAGGAAVGTAFTGLASFAGISTALGPIGLGALAVVGLVALASMFVPCIGDMKPIDIEEVNLPSPVPLGGAKGNITIGQGIYSNNKITFYVFALPEQPVVIEDLNVLGMMGDISEGYPEKIRPDLS